MLRASVAMLSLVALAATAPHPAKAQDARSVVAAASRAMGVETLDGIKLWGSAAVYQVGQNNNAEGPWPQNNLNDYVRATDFEQATWRATAVTYGVPVTGGAAVRGEFNQVVPSGAPWAMQYVVWTTPWGFLKGAARADATVKTETVGGRAFKVVTWSPSLKSASGKAYTVIGHIGPTNLVERVTTWTEHPVFGDMKVEISYTDYRDRDGLKYPTTSVYETDGHPFFTLQTLSVQANPPDLQALLTPPPGPAPNPPPAPQGPASEKLAEGVWRIRGAYNALAVEFADYVVLFEPGPQNEARAQAILAETRRVIPNKPIRYGVISHHHFDHTGGLQAVAAEGIVIVTPEVNKAFLERALGGPRTLAPDALGRSGRKPVIETMGDKRVFQDANHSFEIHEIKGLPHADGLVVGYLPKEKILVYADMFNLPTAAEPVPNPPVVGTQVFLANIERLGLQPERILSVHTLNPDRLTSLEDIRASLGLSRR